MRNGQAAAPPTARPRHGAGASSTTSTPPSPPPPTAQREFERRGLDDRRKAVDCIRKICIEQAETLGREELEETKIGRLDAQDREADRRRRAASPGVEFLRTDAFSGENGITLHEYAPFGVIGVITPVTHSLPTLAGNAINMLAAGNTVVCNPHPGGAQHRLQGRRSCSTRRSTRRSASTT